MRDYGYFSLHGVRIWMYANVWIDNSCAILQADTPWFFGRRDGLSMDPAPIHQGGTPEEREHEQCDSQVFSQRDGFPHCELLRILFRMMSSIPEHTRVVPFANRQILSGMKELEARFPVFGYSVLRKRRVAWGVLEVGGYELQSIFLDTPL